MCPRDKLRVIFIEQDFNTKMEGKERALNSYDMKVSLSILQHARNVRPCL